MLQDNLRYYPWIHRSAVYEAGDLEKSRCAGTYSQDWLLLTPLELAHRFKFNGALRTMGESGRTDGTDSAPDRIANTRAVRRAGDPYKVRKKPERGR